MQLINLKTLSEMLGDRSASSIYRDIAAKKLPRPVKIGNSSRWIASEVEATLAKLAEVRHG